VHSDLFGIDGNVAIVTGASSGLGERFVRVLHAAGATVVAAARRGDRLDALAEELGRDRVVPVVCDVAVDDDCAALVAAAVEAGRGRFDILVNNAGTSGPTAAEDEPVDFFRRMVDVNLTGVFTMCQLAGRQFLTQGGGVIINVSSILGQVASAPIKQASYCATKGAVINLTRELACQWARKGIRVNALTPGWFLSEMTSDMFADAQSMQWLERNCPMARAGEPGELDGALLFLASGASSYMTGQVLTVDGGWTAR